MNHDEVHVSRACAPESRFSRYDSSAGIRLQKRKLDCDLLTARRTNLTSSYGLFFLWLFLAPNLFLLVSLLRIENWISSEGMFIFFVWSEWFYLFPSIFPSVLYLFPIIFAFCHQFTLFILIILFILYLISASKWVILIVAKTILKGL